jgi:leader peptidase (prepilin peptidase) / N-methyltransferase
MMNLSCFKQLAHQSYLSHKSYAMTTLYFVVNALLGLAFGSFAGMAVSRLLENKNFLGRSRCDSCNKKLSVLELIPVLSYLFLQGKCKTCGKKIENIHIAMEVLTAVLFVVNAYLFPNITKLIMFDIFSLLLMIISFCDIKAMIVPDKVMYILAGFSLIFSYYLYGSIVQIIFMPILLLITAVVMRASVDFFLHKQSLGDADVKLFTVCGLLLLPSTLGGFLVLCGIFGIISSYMLKKLDGGHFPFVPSISGALYISLVTKIDFAYYLI